MDWPIQSTHGIAGMQTLQLELLGLSCIDAEWFWASSGPTESHLAKRGGGGEKKTHGCIYRKMRPHNTLFGERIIKEPRCAGARVPVFWLTLCKQAGPRMNQGWDAGPTLWHTHRKRLHLLFMHTHPLLMRRLLWFQERGMGQYFEFVTFCLWLWVVGFFFFFYIILEKTGHRVSDIQDEEVFAKQKGQILFSTEQTRLSVSSQRFL